MPPHETKDLLLKTLGKKHTFFSSLKKIFGKKRADKEVSKPQGLISEPSQDKLIIPILEADSSPASSFFCQVCLEHLPNSKKYTLKTCHCTFCKDCVQSYIEGKIKEGEAIVTCLDKNCRIQGTLDDDEICQFIPPNMVHLYEKLKLNAEVARDPTKCWCPAKRCEAICHHRPTQPGEVVAVFCQSCSFTFCSGCKRRWHPRRSCQQLSEHMEQINKLGQTGNIKYCPKCIVPIEHTEGCAQMVCKQCRHVFCWHCLQSLQGDLFLRHYDEGPCKDKLGHPRIGIFVHRFGTYATYTALTVAILFGAPLLLVCLPCLLCVFHVYNTMPEQAEKS